MMDTIIIFIFHNTDFFCSLARSWYFSRFSLFQSYSVICWNCNICCFYLHIPQLLQFPGEVLVFFYSLFITLWFTGTALFMIYQTNIFLLAITLWLELSGKSSSQIPRVFYSLFSRTASGFCSYHLFI